MSTSVAVGAEEERVVKNPLLVVMERQEEKKKIRERRRMIRAERRRKAEARRAGASGDGAPGSGSGSSTSGSSSSSGRRRGPPSKQAKLPPSKLSLGVSFARANSDISAEMKVTGPREPWIESGNRPKSSSEEDSSGLSEREKEGTGSASSKRASQTVETIARANGHATGGSPSKLPSISSSSGKVATRAGAEANGGGRVKGGNTARDRLVKQIATKARDSEKEEYLNENDLHEICQWLELLRLPLDYLGLLVEEGFDNLTAIKLLQEEDLRHLGIAKTGHRKKIMYWVAHNRPEAYDEFAEGLDDDLSSIETSSMASEPYWSSAESFQRD